MTESAIIRVSRLRRAALIAVALTWLPAVAWDARADALIEGAKECTRYLPGSEQTNGIPVYLLSAIASTESGRWHDGLRITLPWPWTINADGKGYFFDTKAQAVAAARRFQAQGVHSIDVGCMQVSLLHHPHAFRSLDEAFEPQSNVAYAAGFLRDLYKEEGNWRAAAAAYHSKTPSFGAEYVSRVLTQWRTIINRVRQAQIAQNGTATTAPLEQQYASLTPATQSQSYSPMHMKVIQVRDAAPAKHNDVLIVRPQDLPLAPSATYLPDVAASVAPSSGPRFIFSD